MAHSHAHSHGEAESTFFLDQLCTIAIGGLLGYTAIGLYQKGWLASKFQLNPNFHVPVLVAGIVLITLVIIRAAAVWKLSGQARTRAESAPWDDEPNHDDSHAGGEHSHGHEHSHEQAECGHDHGHGGAHSQAECGHDHSHGAHSHAGGEEEHDDHNHGWAPWTYAVLLIPAVLFFLRLPEDGYIKKKAAQLELDATVYQKRVAFAQFTGGMAFPVLNRAEKAKRNPSFSQMMVIASRESYRREYEGKIVTLRGMYVEIPGKDSEFTLKRVKVTCCGADATMLQSRIISPIPLSGFRNDEWVEIEGEISFAKVAGRDEYVPVIQLQTADGLRKIEKPENADFEA